MDTNQVIRQKQEEQGWTDVTLLGLLIEFISNQQCDIALEDYLADAGFHPLEEEEE